MTVFPDIDHKSVGWPNTGVAHSLFAAHCSKSACVAVDKKRVGYSQIPILTIPGPPKVSRNYITILLTKSYPHNANAPETNKCDIVACNHLNVTKYRDVF